MRPVQDKCADAGPPFDEALELEFPVRLEHRVRVDGELGDNFFDCGQLVTLIEQAEAQRVPDLVGYLDVRGDAGFRVQAERDHGRKEIMAEKKSWQKEIMAERIMCGPRTLYT